MSENIEVPLIFGHPFLATAKALIDVGEGKLTLRLGVEKIVNKGYSSQMSWTNRDYNHTISKVFPYVTIEITHPIQGIRNDEEETKIDKNGAKMTKTKDGTNTATTAHGRLAFRRHYLLIAFVCNSIVVRLDYLQGCLELGKEEQSRGTNWGLIGAID
ncbi:hypothetical protein M9H77_23330 [Catharanthus roseus]|uniref:Uncharacterized protein n=1 Tax=Catharanthus roseus TaxID=4058 RepID=A0ACC0AVK0_CATRO|nr:hypothetical protein M9H77_23330 [Catharanthus roseus]